MTGYVAGKVNTKFVKNKDAIVLIQQTVHMFLITSLIYSASLLTD